MSVILIQLFLSAALSTGPGAGGFVHDQWGPMQGLPQSSVTAILRTRDGYLWLGTQGGLVRFDGVRFTVFSPSTHPGLRNSRIRALFEDRNQTLWIATEDGLVNYEHGVFSPLAQPQPMAGAIATMAGPDDGLLFVGPKRITRGDGSTLFSGTGISSIAAGDSGETWIGTTAGLVKYASHGVITYTAADGLPDGAVLSLLKARDGTLWVGTTAGLAQFEAGRVTRVYRRELRDPEVWSL